MHVIVTNLMLVVFFILAPVFAISTTLVALLTSW